MQIKGYELRGELKTTNSGFSKWGFAAKNGREYFIKEFIDPVYPVCTEFLDNTHRENYLDTAEGKKLPVPHCIKGTPGWMLDSGVAAALEQKGYTPVEKLTFGSVLLPRLLYQAAAEETFTMELVGLCTDICVVSNALMLKANFPEMEISVDSACCAGVTPATHEAALATMRCCQINVK